MGLVSLGVPAGLGAIVGMEGSVGLVARYGPSGARGLVAIWVGALWFEASGMAGS